MGISGNKDFTGGTFAGPSIYQVILDDSANKVFGYVDGTDLSGGGFSSYTTAPSTPTTFGLMRNRGFSTFPDGYAAEFVLVPSVLSTTDRQKMEGYLAHKWGLASKLPGNHPYKLSPFFVTSWDSQVVVSSSQAAGNIDFSLSGLSANTSYYFKARAINAGGNTWSDGFTFTTSSNAVPPVLDSSAATSVATNAATVNGSVLSFDGSDAPAVTLYYDNDGNYSLDRVDPLIPLSFSAKLGLWLDASDTSSITAASGSVSQWSDKSGNALHVVQATADKKPSTGSTTQN